MSKAEKIKIFQNSSFLLRLPYEELLDQRTKNWLLVESFPVVTICIGFYILMVWHLPKWMARRKPYTLRWLLIFYNFGLTLLNAHIFVKLLVNALRLNYNFLCQPCREIYSDYEMQIAASKLKLDHQVFRDTLWFEIASAVWWFYISKLLEFTDTLFFILRKKSEQLSFLHIYHHSTMFPLWWIAIKWVPTGSTFFPAMINSFVHIIMYSYYGLSAVGPSIHKYLWWKKYLTGIQLVQFVIGLLWSIQALMSGCEFPKWINYVTIIYMTTFLILFGQFYERSYHKKAVDISLKQKLK